MTIPTAAEMAEKIRDEILHVSPLLDTEMTDLESALTAWRTSIEQAQREKNMQAKYHIEMARGWVTSPPYMTHAIDVERELAKAYECLNAGKEEEG